MTYDPAGLGLSGGLVRTGYDGIRGSARGDTSRAGPAPTGSGPQASGLYLRLGSGPATIAGDSTDRDYENWIKLGSFQMGVGVGLMPQGTGFTQSIPSVSEVTVTQTFDGAVPVVLSNLMRGRNIGQATIELVQGGANGPVTSMQVELDNVIFSGLSLSSGGDRPSVSTSMNFTGFTQTIWDVDAEGNRGDADIFSYDMLTNSVRDRTQAARSVSGFGAGMLEPMAQQVPEPQTWALMAGGIALLTGLRRRRPG